MPKPRRNANRVKPVPHYKGVPSGVLENRVLSINEEAFKEIERLEQLIKNYKTLIAMMEIEWQPKKTASPIGMESIAQIRAKLKTAE